MFKMNQRIIERKLQSPSSPWFKNWFDSSFYHQLYGNHDDREAAGFIHELLLELDAPAGARILDLGCGNGRHSRVLAEKGFDVTGIDLAGNSIATAKRFEKEHLNFYSHDMRDPFGRNLYNYVFSFFTSFGYFKEENDNHRVVRNIYHALATGGVLMMDYLNVEYADAHLVKQEEKNIDGVHYHLERWTDEHNFYKKISIDIQNGKPLEFTEQVARFGLGDFHELFIQHGLQIEKVFGDYDLVEYDRMKSPRLIMIAKKV